MSNVRTLSKSFSGGEVTPEFWGQIGDAKFQTGLALCRNFIPLAHGPLTNRPGTRFVREVKLPGQKVRLIPFEFSAEQTLVLEFGAGYIRQHTQGATVEDTPGVPYEIATDYALADLFDLHYVQSADVLTIVHPKYPPRELRRLGATNWELKTIAFTPTLAAPATLTGVATTATGPTGLRDYVYKVTTKTGAGDESYPSVSVTLNNNLLQTGAYNTLTWPAAPGGSRYCVYLQENGLYGYIGETDGLTFKDDNITPDLSKTPPVADSPFTPPGSILSVPVTAGGTAYGTTLSGGEITAVTLTVPGVLGSTGATPTLTVSDPSGSGAVFKVNYRDYVFGRQVQSVTVLDPGSNYTNPTFTWSGTPAQPVTATVTPVVYSTPTLSISDPTGTGAVLLPEVTAGSITGVTVANPGQGYTAPVVAVDNAAGGSGATFGTPDIGEAGDYPGAVSYHEQRRVFAGTTRRPQNIWMTRTGTESNFNYSIPARDDDRVAFRVLTRQVNIIRHMVPLTSLVVLTSSAEWRVEAADSGAITPSNISSKPQSNIGASNVQPVLVNNNILYGAARGGHLREMAFNWQAQGYVTGDLSLRAPHLFDGLTITDLTYSKSPQPVVWAVSSNGKLLGLTYVPEQQIGAWHQHDTGAGDEFVSVCTVVEGDEDAVYAAVRRTVDGEQRVYIERFASRQFEAQADAVFVDSSLTYRGAEVSTVTGLTHLEGRTVNILADGAEHPQRLVEAGAIALDNPASVITVGLPILADAKTLPMAFEVQGFGQGRVKNVNKVWLRVNRSSGIHAGPDFDNLVPYKQRTTEPMGSPPNPVTDEIEIVLTPSWQSAGQVCIRQSSPLPLTIVSMSIEAAVGG